MKKKFVFFLIVVFFSYQKGFAQQKLMLSQYMLNQYVLNPAVGGTGDFVEAYTGYRMQWVGLEGAPRTFYLTIQGPVGKAPAQYNWKTKKKYFHGLGAYFAVDKTGLLSRTLAYGSYAYNMPLTRKLRLSTGIFLGFQQYRIDGASVRVDGYDPSLPGIDINKIIPDVSLGSWLYHPDYYVGLSINQILGSRLDYSINKLAESPGRLKFHYFLTAGYKFPFYYNEMEWIPSFLARWVNPAPLSVDINSKIRYKKTYWVGVSYRHKDAVAVMVGAVFLKSIHVGYSYDLSISPLSKYQSNSHEIVLGYTFSRHYDVWSPSRFW